MSMDTPDVVVAVPPASGAAVSYIDWSAILGGAALSTAITVVLMTFGSAVGLSMASFDLSEAASPTTFAIAAGLWAIWITVCANASGAYLAGRMRPPVVDAGPHEREMRDGAQGLVVWAVGALLIAVVTTSSLLSTARTAASGVASAASGVGTLVTQQADPLASALDTVMRSTGATPPTQQEREEASRILVSSLREGRISPEDRSYLASRIAVRLNIPQPEAEKQLDTAYTRLEQARRAAQDAAERARRFAVITAFVTAAALLIGAATAWFAAQLGGKHRDDQIDLGDMYR